MTQFDQAAVFRSLELGEGLRLQAYDDATGKRIVPGYLMVGHPTIGYGTCLDTDGITATQAQMLCLPDVIAADEGLERSFSWYQAVPEGCRQVLIEMAYNMGVAGLSGFPKMLAAVMTGDWNTAAAEMLDSEWAKQVGTDRSERLAAQMRQGV